MLPSTGNFKEFSCPFFDSGLCERPYCHFRHVKKETSDSLPPVASSLSLEDNGEMLQQLVSEAVKKVLQQTEILPGALGSSAECNPVESVSQTLVTKVVEKLTPPLSGPSSPPKYNEVEDTQTKAPSYKPTPISVLLKKRHIPIPYSPTLSKNTNVMLKRRNCDVSSTHKRAKVEEYEPCVSNVEKGVGDGLTHYSPTVINDGLRPSASYTPSTVFPVSNTSSKNEDVGSSLNCELDYDPYDENIKRVSGYSVTESSAYSPSPIGGWNDTTHSYTPSSIDTLNTQEHFYIPSSNNLDKELSLKYNPTDKSKESSEPTYVPLGADNQAGESAMYKPSSVSNCEPEYHPQSEETAVKQYFPTDISTLDSNINEDIIDSFSSEIDLLHEILKEDLDNEVSDIDSEDRNELRKSASNKSEDKSKSNSNVVPHELKQELNLQGESRLKDKTNSFTNLNISASKLNASCLERVQTSKSGEKKSDSSKSSNSSKKKKDFDKKSSSDRKKSDSDKKQSSNNKKQSENHKHHIEGTKDVKKSDKDSSSKRKHSKSEKKHSESDKHKHDSVKKRSEGVRKKSDSDRKKDSTERKQSDNSKHTLRKLDAVETHKSVRHANKDIVHTDLSKRHKEHKSKSKPSSVDKHIHSHSQIHTSSNCDTRWKVTAADKNQERRSSSNKSRSEISSAKCAETKGSNDSKHKKKYLKNNKHKHHKERKELEEDGNGRTGSAIELSESDEESSDDLHFIDNVTLPSDMGASSSDEDTVTKECFRIFQEYEPAKISSSKQRTSQVNIEKENTSQVIGKKRVAHEAAQNSSSGRIRAPKRPTPCHPSQGLANRFKKLKETHTAQVEANINFDSPPIVMRGASSVGFPTSATSQLLVPPGRVRIAHVPNVSLLLNAKLKMQQNLQERQLNRILSTPSHTVAQSPAKGGHRVAHMPAVSILARPIITEVGGRIPVNVRQNYLNIMVDEYLKISTNDAEAFQKATDEEKSIFSRSTTRTVYSSHMSNTINRLRKSASSSKDSNTSIASTSKVNISSLQSSFGNRTVSHTSVLAGKGGSKGSWSIEKPKKPPPVSLTNIYQEFHRHILTEDLLKSNGFPTAHPEEKGVALVHAFYKAPFVPSTPLQRQCCRCSKIYYVNKQGFAVEEKPCVYHWGRLFQSKVRSGTWESRYSCCQTDADSSGCMMGPSHVSDNYDPKCMRGFVKTLPKEQIPNGGDYGVYALDCEMCYTTYGLELTRVTVIGTNLETVYETLVKPENSILDYNTRFSGITEEDMVNVTTNIFEVQSALLSFINDKTILVGHSLESDFKALKLIHGTVVDTSVVYPHKHGPPKKKALKSLCRELLHKIIQEGEGGHDSAEDAKACMEIMMFTLKEDLKTR